MRRWHVLPVVTDFLKAFPDINIRLMMSDRPVNLADEHIDLALRISRLSDSGLIATRLGSIRTTVYASSDYTKRHSGPHHPRDLVDHDFIAFEGVFSSRFWTFRDRTKEISVPIRMRLSVNTAQAAVDAATAGLGVTRVMENRAKRAVEAGLLVSLLEDFEMEASPVQLLHTKQGLMPLKLKAFLEFAAPQLRARLV